VISFVFHLMITLLFLTRIAVMFISSGGVVSSVICRVGVVLVFPAWSVMVML